ncbi:AraC family transcriptional regulator [Lentzea sp. NPDC059081]|uniref:helix-turn-helix transcriptional regulator n=1 Tax=Lentzea sp. NPDC059081 TaxID=3346719 RepID=UPI0036C1CD9E
MVDDQLSEVFELVEVRGVLSDGFAVSGPWVVSGELAEESLKLIASVTGTAELTVDGVDEPLRLEAGDVAVLNGRSWLRLRGGEGDGPPAELVPGEPFAALAGADRAAAGNVCIGGRIELNETGRALLLPALPPAGVVRAPAAPNLRHDLDRVADELIGGRIGSSFAIRQRGQLLALEVMRAFAGHSALPAGWLRLLADGRLRPALSLMSADPGRPWGLEELARAAGMSRTTFAERFRAAAGMPPLAYLGHWRMLLAQRALRDDDAGIRALAGELGYASESAFSAAFKRVVGEAPAHYRTRVRSGASRF